MNWLDETFWTGVAVGSVVNVAAQLVGRRIAARRAKLTNNGIPKCWSCRGFGYILRPSSATSSAIKERCTICDGQGWTTKPRMVTTPSRPRTVTVPQPRPTKPDA